MKAGVIAFAAAFAGGVNARDLGRRHGHQDFHARELLATGTGSSEACGCTTVWSTVTGEPQLYFPPSPTLAVSSNTGLSAPSAPAQSASVPSGTTDTGAPCVSSGPVLSGQTACPVAPGSSASSAPIASIPASSAPASSASAASQAVSSGPLASPVVIPTPLTTIASTPGVYTIPATTITLTESTTVCGATSTGLPSAGTYTGGGVTTVVTTETTVVCPYAAMSTTDGVVTSTILTTTYYCPAAGTYTIAPLTTTVTEPAVWVYPTPASFIPGTYTQPEVVTTITETNVVIFCPYSSSESTLPAATYPASTPAQATSAPISAAVSVVVPVSSSIYVAPSSSSVYVTPSSSSVYVAPSSSSAPVASSSVIASSAATPSASSSSSSGNGGGVGSSGNKWAMTYTPYQDSGACKTADQVSTDIALIASKGFSAVRIYSTDCSGLANVGSAAKASGLKIIVGIFIGSTGISQAATQVTDLISWGEWSLVELIVVGNESVFNGYCTAAELAAFISSSKSSFQAVGYTGQVTTTEPLNIWQENTEALCSVVDITAANLHPFFNAQVSAEKAGEFANSELELADAICSGKTAINLETGWPSAGTCNGLACPGVEEQKTAVASIVESCGGRVAIFSFTNDLWKAPGSFGAERSWGSIHLF